MSIKEKAFFEELMFKYIDEYKFIFFPDKWSNLFLDYSKNEFLAIVFIYRNKNVTISDISEYIDAPLNTVTGVINRLEKKKMVTRIRDTIDKRVVNISLTSFGEDEFIKAKDEIIYFIKKIYSELNDEEMSVLFGVVSKVMGILKDGKNNEVSEENIKKKKVRKITIE